MKLGTRRRVGALGLAAVLVLVLAPVARAGEPADAAATYDMQACAQWSTVDGFVRACGRVLERAGVDDGLHTVRSSHLTVSSHLGGIDRAAQPGEVVVAPDLSAATIRTLLPGDVCELDLTLTYSSSGAGGQTVYHGPVWAAASDQRGATASVSGTACGMAAPPGAVGSMYRSVHAAAAVHTP